MCSRVLLCCRLECMCIICLHGLSISFSIGVVRLQVYRQSIEHVRNSVRCVGANQMHTLHTPHMCATSCRSFTIIERAQSVCRVCVCIFIAYACLTIVVAAGRVLPDCATLPWTVRLSSARLPIRASPHSVRLRDGAIFTQSLCENAGCRRRCRRRHDDMDVYDPCGT